MPFLSLPWLGTPSDVIVVSGLSAAHTIYLNGGNVVVLDKQGFFGGNSTKVSSTASIAPIPHH